MRLDVRTFKHLGAGEFESKHIKVFQADRAGELAMRKHVNETDIGSGYGLYLYSVNTRNCRSVLPVRWAT